MVPGFLHCCILTERKKEMQFFLLKAAHLKRWLYREQILKAKIEYLTITLISLKINSLSKSVQIEVCDQAGS